MISIKILFLNRWVGMHSGGTESIIKELASRLTSRGHNVEIFTTKGGELKRYETKLKVNYVSRPIGRVQHAYSDVFTYVNVLLFLLKSFLKFFELTLRGIRYDVVSVHFFSEAFLMRFVRKIFGAPYVFVFSGYTDLEAREARHANSQIAISQHIIKKCYENYGYKPLLIPKGIDRSRFYADANGKDIRKKYNGDNKKLVLTICELQRVKDVPTLVSAADIVCKRNPNVRFIIVGSGEEKERIEKQIEKLGLSDKVRLIGRIPFSSADLPKYYRACDIFVLPSIHEFSPVVLQEAMSSGLPIIATSVGGIPDLVGDCGILLPPRRPDLLAEAVLKVLHDDELRKRMRRKGLARAEAYNWDRLIIEYENTYKSVCKA